MLSKVKALIGYTLKGIDDERWVIRYLIIATRNWWPGKKVLVSPQWIDRVSWEDAKIFVNLSRETIKMSPEYTDDFLLNRDYEDNLHKHYNRQGYWVDAPLRGGTPVEENMTNKVGPVKSSCPEIPGHKE
ncbi:MAG: hypothetical protein WA705_07255 [Candidatus Ozemobacteraceae bacterium]